MNRMKKALHLHLGVICAGALVLPLPDSATAQTTAAGKAPAGAVTDERLRHADEDPGNWLTHGGNWQETRFSRLTDINATNVTALKPAWSAEFDTTRGQEATPLVVDGVMYVSTSWSKLYALDAATGRRIWFYDPQVPGATGARACCDVVNRGVTVYEGNVYIATLDGRLVALNAGTGKPLWVVRMFEFPSRRYTSTGAPRAARGKIFIGNAGADFGGRGFVSAYDAQTGKRIWRFYTVPSDPAGPPDGEASDAVLKSKALKTWSGDWLKYGGGGQVWNALVYDPDFNQLYMATGNGFPWNQNYRSNGGGDNLFISSIIAVDADTGEYHWHYQETPGDRWDFDAISDMTLVDLPLAGGVRKVLLHAPKNGFLYVLDRKTGQLLSADPFVPGINWATGVDLTTGRPNIAPAALYQDAPFLGIPGGGGAHSWHPVSFSPDTGLLYFPAAESSTFYAPTPNYHYEVGVESIGVDLAAATHGAASARPHMPPRKDYLLAWNPVTRKAAFSVPGSGGGVLTTAGNLIFQGRPREGVLGTFVAMRATDGRKLWSWDTPDAMPGGPVTYRVNGEQYVAVISGALTYSFTTTPRIRHNGRMLAFKLNGSGTFPPDPPLAPAPNPPAQLGDPAQVALGDELYAKRCGLCHGFEAVSGNMVPDLRRSAFLLSPAGWQSVVIGGALAPRGMISWKEFVTPAEAEAIRVYVGERARSLKLDLDHNPAPAAP
jgi:quinohemoprotein ethanol dehydrogenase